MSFSQACNRVVASQCDADDDNDEEVQFNIDPPEGKSAVDSESTSSSSLTPSPTASANRRKPDKSRVTKIIPMCESDNGSTFAASECQESGGLATPEAPVAESAGGNNGKLSPDSDANTNGGEASEMSSDSGDVAPGCDAEETAGPDDNGHGRQELAAVETPCQVPIILIHNWYWYGSQTVQCWFPERLFAENVVNDVSQNDPTFVRTLIYLGPNWAYLGPWFVLL
jgi:hypothetical protein